MRKNIDTIDRRTNILLIASSIVLRREISNILLKNYEKTWLTNNLKDGEKIFYEYKDTINLLILCVPLKEKNSYMEFVANLKALRCDLEVYIIAKELDTASIIEITNLGISKLMIEPFDRDGFAKDVKSIAEKIENHRLFEGDLSTYEDPITKLPNKLRLMKDIKEDESYYLMVFNVDGFRQIHNCYGVEAADFVSFTIAQILSKYEINPSFRLYKIQIDEYALLITCKYSRLDYEALSIRIANELTQTANIFEGREIYYNVSVGTSTSEFGNKELVRNAGVALTTAKSKKSIITTYDPSIEDHENNKAVFWLKELKHAIKNNQVILYYQPIISSVTGEIVEVEALMRIKKEDGSLYMPNEFIHVSKEIKVYNQLTKIVINKAVDFIKDHHCRISINLSFEDIINEETKSFILDKLKEEVKIRDKISFELTESESVTNYTMVSNFINDITKLGSEVAIDDFGAGYSNYYSLLKLNINYLKIDGSLIKNIITDKYAQAIVKSIVNLTKELGIKTVAEFVSSEEILIYVKELGIDYFQGYYISPPLTESQLVSLLKNKQNYLSEIYNQRETATQTNIYDLAEIRMTKGKKT
ncbi:EAL domain, c-di-GMP-specific phosphodiesterase class I (or its enzymatically inactive variant) [Natronincola peptidivorans]|uniref:EAL domain, c-di-GMP-specific phosphodiesterase class I (Or its enzymatically inactive variant) n=1 Tax=Natronincola peptidivorans TaxID=426128 RepID=A0A1I0BYN0_9FIRM|nr:EAL domain-containing protein [Natronincola peptidivorans]SET11638.1 EAL domain, c-di-GMP-specific phosphodiesterase class I (or its enzymatically inactive variant) [Natronincola peptidivorans]